MLLLAAAQPAVGASVRPSEAAAYVGRMVELEGLVQQVACSPRACLLSFEAGWSGLVVTIPAADLVGIRDPKARFERRTVRVTGVVENRGGRLRMELGGPSRIEVVEDESGKGSRVLSTEEKSPKTEPAVPELPSVETRVRVEGAESLEAKSHLGAIVRDLEQEGGESGGGSAASTVPQSALRGLRERVSVQSQTIRDLEGELTEVRSRLQELEERPEVVSVEPSRGDVPHLDPWVVPARQRLSDPRPRTGWSEDRLVRELGSPREVSPIGRDRAVWFYDGGRAVTVARGRVVSTTGF